MNRVWHGTGHCFLDGRPWSGWRAQRTRFMVSSTTVSFGANLLATVQAHLEAMPRPQSQPKSPPESGPEPTAISFCAVCERPFFGASERAWAGPLKKWYLKGQASEARPRVLPGMVRYIGRFLLGPRQGGVGGDFYLPWLTMGRVSTLEGRGSSLGASFGSQIPFCTFAPPLQPRPLKTRIFLL